MTLRSVRDTSALILIAGHILAIMLVFMRLQQYFERVEERMEIVLILSPLTGLFALAALKDILNSAHTADPKVPVRFAFAFACLGIPSVFTSVIIYTILRYPFGIADSPQSLRLTLSAVEVALGGLIGAVSDRLFGVNISSLRKMEAARIRDRA
jgi:chromate transport protein ChrA